MSETVRATEADVQPQRALQGLSEQISRLEQLLAALAIVMADDTGSPEIAETGDALAGWAMETLDVERLSETLGDFLEAARSQAPAPVERQQELFPRQPPEGDPA